MRWKFGGWSRVSWVVSTRLSVYVCPGLFIAAMKSCLIICSCLGVVTFQRPPRDHKLGTSWDHGRLEDKDAKKNKIKKLLVIPLAPWTILDQENLP